MLMNIGEKPILSKNGLHHSCLQLERGQMCLRSEGSVAITGAAVQWLRDNLRLLDDAPDSEYLARKVGDSGGMYFVPAFSGLYAPYWDRPRAARWLG